MNNPIRAARRLLTRAVRAVGRRLATVGTTKRVKATYDAAQTTAENEDYYAWADALNANALNDPSTRKVLRERSRYEQRNNGYCGGMVRKMARDTVGSLPRPQLSIPGATRDAGRAVEREFLKWARQTGLGAKLRTLDEAASGDGEGFGYLCTNPRLDPQGVQLDLRLYETDQVSTPYFDWADPLAFDGGRLDEFGNVVEWHLLKAHPGSDVWVANFLDFDRVPSERMVHWFNPRRAGQLRGAPEIASGMTLFAYLRRFTLASLVSAETAAKIAGILKIDTPPGDPGADPDPITAMDEISIPRGALLTTPGDVMQLKAEQPTTTYPMFKTEVLTEAGAGVGAPQCVSTNSAAAYNYSSARLDHGIYQGGIRVRRSDFRDRVLDPLFRAWLDEAALVPGLLPDGLPPISQWSWEWNFDGFPSLDPVKDAQADEINLRNGTTTYAEICGRDGRDWEEVRRQRAREIALDRELGILPAAAPPAPTTPAPAPDPAETADAVAAA